MDELSKVIAERGLAALPVEGGWFRRRATSPERRPDGRPVWSEIEYLMSPEGFSAMHRLAAVETWTHLEGAAAELLLLGPGMNGRQVRIGPGDGVPMVRIEAGIWQGAVPCGPWSLCLCRVEPAWRDEDFELGSGAQLAAQFPEWAGAIRTRVR